MTLNPPYQSPKPMEGSKTSPLVTVVIPMFNAFPFIGEMLECMEKQTYSNWELIIVDDGSTDESVSTVEKFAENDSRIKLIKRPESRKKGGNTCRNIGLENANGEYIIWFDADDLIAPYCLEQRVNFIQNHNDIDFAIFPAMAFREKIGDTYMITGAKRTSNDYHHFLMNLVPFQVVTNIYHRKSLLSNDIKWDEDLQGRQDPDFNISTIKKSLNYKYSHLKPDYFWRLNGNNQSISKQILTTKKLETNIYYLKKRYTLDLTSETNSSIKFLTFFILNPLLINMQESAVKNILNIVNANNGRISEHKVGVFFKLAMKLGSSNTQSLFLCFFFPINFTQLYIRTKLWNFKIKYLAYRYRQLIPAIY